VIHFLSFFFIFHDGRAANTPAGMRPDGESIKASTPLHAMGGIPDLITVSD
jgi:hypothetical protein